MWRVLALTCVMPGHSRSKNGVASLAYVPGISLRDASSLSEMAGTSPAMTREWSANRASADRQSRYGIGMNGGAIDQRELGGKLVVHQ